LAKYPTSITTKKSLSQFFYDILTFHVPFNPSTTILDPTCGKRYLWKKFFISKPTFFEEEKKQLINEYDNVIFSDIKDFGYNKVLDLFTFTHTNNPFNAIVYDPPYYYNSKDRKSSDKRANDYGNYTHTFSELLHYMKAIDQNLAPLLKVGGKLILKCADQYQPQERKFIPLHIQWAKNTKLELIDFYVFGHHNMNPTAFQVKNRPCSVIMHTYFMVFQKKEDWF